MSRLRAIAEKPPIVPTFRACALRDTATDVCHTYSWHAGTFVEQPALTALCQSFVDAVRQAKTPKACLIAPFGYGKPPQLSGYGMHASRVDCWLSLRFRVARFPNLPMQSMAG